MSQLENKIGLNGSSPQVYMAASADGPELSKARVFLQKNAVMNMFWFQDFEVVSNCMPK